MSPLFESRAADVLTDDQMRAVGKVAVEWGMLEFAIHAHALGICRIFSGLTFGILTRKPSGSTMAMILHDILPNYLGEHPVVSQLQAVLKQVKAVSDSRNDVVHGVWNITPAVLGNMAPSPMSDEILNVIIKQHGASFKQATWTTDSLLELADTIANIRLELNRLIHPLPFPIGRDAGHPLSIPDYRLPPAMPALADDA